MIDQSVASTALRASCFKLFSISGSPGYPPKGTERPNSPVSLTGVNACDSGEASDWTSIKREHQLVQCRKLIRFIVAKTAERKVRTVAYKDDYPMH